MKRNVVCSIMIIISLILAVIGYIALPDKVIVQIGADGQPSNMLPKLPAVIMPVVITGIGAVGYAVGEEESKVRNIIIVVAGYVVALFSIIVNMSLRSQAY